MLFQNKPYGIKEKNLKSSNITIWLYMKNQKKPGEQLLDEELRDIYQKEIIETKKKQIIKSVKVQKDKSQFFVRIPQKVSRELEIEKGQEFKFIVLPGQKSKPFKGEFIVNDEKEDK